MLEQLRTLPDFIALTTDPGDESVRTGHAITLIKQQAPEVYTELEGRWLAHAQVLAIRIPQLRRRVTRSIALATAVVIASTALISAMLVVFGVILLRLASIGPETPSDAPLDTMLTSYRGMIGAYSVVTVVIVALWLAWRYYPFFISGELAELRELQHEQAKPSEGRREAFIRQDVTMLLRSVR
jgi:hypothetical protein